MAQPLKRLSLNIQTFEKLIEDNSIYVDKTDQIHKIITTGSTYFLSRPRRFGKSLLISTLEAIFQGRKELFEGLVISKTDYTWQEYPVIRLDFSKIKSNSAEVLEQELSRALLRIAQRYEINIKNELYASNILEVLIEELSENRNKVVILIDEYDKPILDHIHNPDAAEKNQLVLRDFFTTIKALDKNIRFIFLTGITKFAKTSVFSSLNNLNDISEKAIAAHLLGYTQAEIERFFPDHLALAAQHRAKPIKDLLGEMRTWYNGYQFCIEQDFERVYSPLSVMYCLNDKFFRNYWFETATSSHLVNLIRLGKYNLSELEELKPLIAGSTVFASSDLSNITLKALLYQAGYLTIQSFDQETEIAILDFPNKEVRESMRILLISMKSGVSTIDVKPIVNDIKNGFLNHDIPAVIQGLQIMVAQIPSMNHINDESYYHSLFQMILITIGFRVESEPNTHTGRPDLVVDSGKQIFVIELKLNKTPALALDQITKKRYYEKYRIEQKPITLLGINVAYNEKRVSVEYVIEELAGL